MTWAFALHPVPDGTTRLLVRERYQYRSWWAALVIEPVNLVSLVMSQRMLRGIKRRAEMRGVHDQRLAMDASEQPAVLHRAKEHSCG